MILILPFEIEKFLLKIENLCQQIFNLGVNQDCW